MKYTKKDRANAIMICAIAASTPGEWYSTIETGLGLSDDDMDRAHDLAVAAYNKVYYADQRLLSDPTIDAEAEALLQCEWSPS